MKEQNRGGFTSSFGVMMALAGSAVGLGNIWRFPYLAGEHGGAAFIIIYLLMVLLVGLPLVLTEFSVGRLSRAGAISSFKVLAPKSVWSNSGYVFMLIGFLLMGVYSVISGWALHLFSDSVFGEVSGLTAIEIKDDFSEFRGSVWQPIAYGLSFVLLSAVIVGRGIEKGVEKWNKILIPVLFFMMIFLCIYSTTLEGWDKAVTFLFAPDWSEVTIRTFIDALGQVFFTLSIGMGVVITYASYAKKKENIFKSKLIVSAVDTSVALMAGLMIFPAVFSFGLEAGEGPELIFLTLPTVFAQLAYGKAFAILFSGVLVIAALTSAISIFEMLTTIFIEQLRMTRVRAVVVLGVMVASLTVLCAAWQSVFNAFDYLSSNVLMVLGGLIMALFFGWRLSKKQSWSVFTNDGENSRGVYKVFIFLVRYIAPVALTVILLSALGLI
ncbi:MAG: sodium-dependent transporter [Rikenellaceae bacterium]